MDGVTLRPAKASDYASVVENSGDLFYGHDILPSMIFTYLDSPHKIMYVADKEGLWLLIPQSTALGLRLLTPPSTVGTEATNTTKHCGDRGY